MTLKYYYFFNEGSRVNQWICAFLINLLVFAYGASVGWMSPMTLLLQGPDSPRDPPLTDFEVSLMGASPYLSSVFADFFVAWMGDKFGRKPTLLFLSATAVAAWIIKLSSMETWAFVLARVLIGIPMAGAYVTCPLYNKEISENCIRGLLGSMLILAHTSGNLFLFVIGDVMSYRPVLWTCLALPAVHFVLFMMMPESPSFLVKSGKLEENLQLDSYENKEAQRVLAWLRCKPEDDKLVAEELDEIRREQKQDEESSRFVLKAIVTDKLLFRAFRIALIIALAREVCGAIPVLNFAGEIFHRGGQGSGLILTPNQQAMMLGAVQVAGSALASSVIEKTGRKMLLFATCLISGISMCILASWFLCKQYSVMAPGWIPVATLCLCIFCDSSGLLPLTLVITGEMFSFKYRGTVMAVTMATAALADFIQMLFFKPLANIVGIHVAFFFFGVICILASIYVFLVVPETKMKTVNEIQRSLKTNKEKQKEIEKSKEASA